MDTGLAIYLSIERAPRGLRARLQTARSLISYTVEEERDMLAQAKNYLCACVRG
jgi:hypothetical protein